MKTTFLKRAILLSVFALAGTSFFAQNHFEIKGKIVKSDRPGGNRANVTLLDSNSMEIVAEQLCNENGEFLIQELIEGNYRIFYKIEKRNGISILRVHHAAKNIL